MAKLYGDRYQSEGNNSAVAVDVETTGLTYLDKVIGISLAWHEDDKIKSCYIDLGRGQLGLFSDGEEFESVEQLIKHILVDKITVWHSVAFDYRFLSKEFGVPAPKLAHDVAHMARCIGYNEGLSLVNLYHQYVNGALPEWYLKTKQLRGSLKNMEPREVARYGRADAYFTLQLFDALKERLPAAFDDLTVYVMDVQFTGLVMDLIKRGIRVNRGWLLERKKIAIDRMVELERQYPGINLNSSQQVSKKLMGLGAPIKRKTSAGLPSVDQAALEALADDYPFARDVLEYRGSIKVIGSWIDPLLQYSQDDGCIHAQLNPFGTVSFRMSCKDINLQGIPMHDRGKASGSLKGAFLASDPGADLWVCDLKQAEVRLAAMLAKDAALAKVIREGQDPYTSMAIEVWGDPTRRDDAKRATLASLYEIGDASFAKKHGISVEAATRILSEFRARFPAIKSASRRFEQFAGQMGYVPLLYGHKRWFGPADETYKAFNQHVQGSLAELMERVMLQIEKTFPGSIRLQVHDSVVIELSKQESVLEDQKMRIAEIVRTALPSDLGRGDGKDCSVPMLVDFERW